MKKINKTIVLTLISLGLTVVTANTAEQDAIDNVNLINQGASQQLRQSHVKAPFKKMKMLILLLKTHTFK